MPKLLAMGGYGVYVWSAYGITACVFAWNAYQAWHLQKRGLNEVKRYWQSQHHES